MNWKLFASIILSFGVAFFQPAIGQENYPFDDVIQSWASDIDLQNASVGFYAVDLKSEEIIADFNGQKSMTPASMMKLSTTIAALDLLGSDYQFTNELFHTGFIGDGGVLYGDLIFRGNGDPTFGSTRLGERPDRIIADYSDAIKKMGIRQIEGDVRIDNSAFDVAVPGTWSWEDLANYYAAVPHPINFLENQFTMVFSTGVEGTKAILNSVTPEVPGLIIENEVYAADINGDETFCFGHPFGNTIEIRGTLPVNQRAYKVKGAIPNPGVFFASKVMDAATRSGVLWSGEISVADPVETQDRSLIVRFSSPPLREIVEQTNSHSVNLFAEALLVSLGEQSGLDNGLKRLSEFWSQNLKNSKGLVQKDGSGLSHYNAISANQLTEMLQYSHTKPWRVEFENSLPVAGVSGTLRNFGNEGILEGKVRAKSGYMTGNRGYAGYMNLQSGRKIAFAIIVNNYSLPPAAMKQKILHLLEELAEKN